MIKTINSDKLVTFVLNTMSKMASNDKHEPVFELIKHLTKAEKRNFKLYATRLSGNQDAKFLSLFDCMDALEFYDEDKILQKCPVKKEQLPNMKAHLYKQLLVSTRLLNVNHSEIMQLREQLEFANILYDKGLFRQCRKITDKLAQALERSDYYPIEMELVSLQTRLDALDAAQDITAASDQASRTMGRITSHIETISDLSNLSSRLYSLYQKLGYARSQKDLDLIVQYFRPRLIHYKPLVKTFQEKCTFYQACAWYYYIQHNFVKSYKYSRLWVGLFEDNPRMKVRHYEFYLKGYAQILEGLYLMRKYKQFVESLERFEKQSEELSLLNNNAYILSHRILYTHKIHCCYMEGDFTKGVRYIQPAEEYINRHTKNLDIHFRMLMNYKFACLYFGAGDYKNCMDYLAKIIGTKDTRIRRDLQCYARILNLIASYESGNDYNIDYQIRSVYTFLVKMNDMNAVQKEILGFLKKLNTIYSGDLNAELKRLYDTLKPFENHPYERRSFYYLDLLSWLESKITNQPVAEIIKGKFRKEFVKPQVH